MISHLPEDTPVINSVTHVHIVHSNSACPYLSGTEFIPLLDERYEN